jgi:hypothetical protein
MGVRVEAPPPIDTAHESSGGGGGDWVELFKAANDIDAALLTGRLDDAAIETRTIKDRREPGAWLYGGSNPWAPVMVYVRRRQLTDAQIVLAEISVASSKEDTQKPAPSRSGHRRLPVIWWATALVLGIALSALIVNQVTSSSGPCVVPVFCNERNSPRP